MEPGKTRKKFFREGLRYPNELSGTNEIRIVSGNSRGDVAHLDTAFARNDLHPK